MAGSCLVHTLLFGTRPCDSALQSDFDTASDEPRAGGDPGIREAPPAGAGGLRRDAFLRANFPWELAAFLITLCQYCIVVKQIARNEPTLEIC